MGIEAQIKDLPAKKNINFLKYIDKHILLTLIGAIGAYFYVILHLNIDVGQELLLSTTDAKTYYEVGEWVFGIKPTEHTIFRPILYPVVLFLTSCISEDYGTVVFQFLLWLGIHGLIFKTIVKLTSNIWLAYLAVLTSITNLSLIALTLHGLTEISVTFLLSLLLYLIVNYFKGKRTTKQFFYILFCTSTLAVVKPLYVFLVPLVIVFGLSKHRKELLTHIGKSVAYTALALSLFLTQLVVMTLKHDVFRISEIGNETFTYYLFAKGIEINKEVDYQEARKQAGAFTKTMRFAYIKEHLGLYRDIYFQNLKENIKADPVFLAFPQGKETWQYFKFMKKVNAVYYWLHMLVLPLLLFTTVKTGRKKDWETLVLLVFLAMITYSILLTSGISFWQGDRLVVPAMAVWLPFYLFALSILFQKNATE